MVFSQDRHEDVLDLCLVQFEPDSSEYIRVRRHWFSCYSDPLTNCAQMCRLHTACYKPWNLQSLPLHFLWVTWSTECKMETGVWIGSLWFLKWTTLRWISTTSSRFRILSILCALCFRYMQLLTRTWTSTANMTCCTPPDISGAWPGTCSTLAGWTGL